jgi:transcription termination factor Rho
LTDEERNRVFLLRNFLGDMPEVEALEFLLKQMSRSKNNREFFQQMVQGA